MLWNRVESLQLTINMRVCQAITNNDPELASHLKEFSEYLLSVGNGTAKTLPNSEYIRIPDEMILPDSTYTKLKDCVYQGFEESIITSPSVLLSKAILATTNNHVNLINEYALSRFPGDVYSRI